MRLLIIAAAAALVFAGTASADRTAPPIRGQPDAAGHCHDAHGKFTACPVHGLAPVCAKGKPCGHTCIAKDKVCHKP